MGWTRANLVGLLLAAPGLAFAQAPAAADPAAVAAARSEADALIAAAQAQDVFENVTGADGTARVRIRHRQSGFACEFASGGKLNRVTIYPGSLPRGEDVGCNTTIPLGSVTTNFTLTGASDAQVLASAAAAIQRRFPDAEPMANARPAMLDRPPPGGETPVPLVARFRRPAPGGVPGALIEEVIDGHVRGWLVEQRTTVAYTDSLAAADYLQLAWANLALEGIRHAPTAGAAVAVAPGPARPQPTAGDIAVARREGDRILAANGAGAAFENVTNAGFASLRHKASGAVCGFDLNGAGAVILGHGVEVSRRADAVSCVSGVADFQSTLTLFPNTDHWTAAQARDSAAAEISGYSGAGAPFQGQTTTLQTRNLPEHAALHLTYASAGHRFYRYVGAAAVGDWIVIETDYGPLDKAMAGSLIGESTLVKTIGDIAQTGGGPR